MTDPFDELIHHLGENLGVELHVDRNRACALKVHENLTVQIQADAAQEKLLIASFICELPPGRFRENVLAEALKANNLPDPRTGVFGYLKTGNRLTLHHRYPLALIDHKKLTMLIAGFIDYADLWREAIARGAPSPAPIGRTTKPPNPFVK